MRGGVRCFVYGSSVGVWGTTPRQLPAGFADGVCSRHPLSRQQDRGGESRPAIPGERTQRDHHPPNDHLRRRGCGLPATLVGLVRKKRLILSRPDIRVHLVSVHAVADCIARILHIGETADDLYVVLDRESVTLRQLADCIHHHFNHTPYPPAITMPRAIFAAADRMFGLLHSDVWKVRMKLLGRDWIYNPLGSYDKLGYVLLPRQ